MKGLAILPSVFFWSNEAVIFAVTADVQLLIFIPDLYQDNILWSSS